MSLRFSRVTLYSAGKTTTFFVGGIPKSRTDLQGWTAYDDYSGRSAHALKRVQRTGIAVQQSSAAVQPRPLGMG